MRISKYHALGNDYLVAEPHVVSKVSLPDWVKHMCIRHSGVGSDGILIGPLHSAVADFGLRIFNPDGSEAEKSGNGLRIFARYLWDQHLVSSDELTIEVPGGVVCAQVLDEGAMVQVGMGRVSFNSRSIPVVGVERDVLHEALMAGGRNFTFCAATIGNPHCVLVVDEVTPQLVQQYGPLIECHPSFPNRTNVQFLKVIDRTNIQIGIWERGAGLTSASGSSSCAAAAVAYRLGLCDSSITVHMPGGVLSIHVGPEFEVQMTGPVTKVFDGELAMSDHDC